jgi:lipase (class 3)
MATFNLYQRVFTLSILANRDSNSSDPSDQNNNVSGLEVDLATKIDTALSSSQMQGLIGNWTCVWGPAIFQNDNSGVADNAMYVAKGTDDDNNPVYVVAIAATNVLSGYDVLTEDLAVGTLAPLPSQPDGPPLISLGTADGVTHLEAMVDQATGASLVQYLNSLGSTGGTLIFTGHSLGGALAPTLAFDLVKYGGLETDNFTRIYVYPTAGPTPGTSEFASLFSDRFPLISTGSNTYQSWNGLVWNSLDMVPHAWSQLLQIRSLYQPSIKSSLCVDEAVAAAGARAALAGQTYVQLQSSGAMQGAFNSSLPSTGVPTCDFLQQALYQHIVAYYNLLGVTEAFTPPQVPPTFCSDFMTKLCKSGLTACCGSSSMI